jgi:hypothetical protein
MHIDPISSEPRVASEHCVAWRCCLVRGLEWRLSSCQAWYGRDSRSVLANRIMSPVLFAVLSPGIFSSLWSCLTLHFGDQAFHQHTKVQCCINSARSLRSWNGNTWSWPSLIAVTHWYHGDSYPQSADCRVVTWADATSRPGMSLGC